ncbi:A-agglutinin anchorage subunit-like [Kryptolebias marmoratus]|uniref:A-agglutinin anchorage subunit-like n=1 Tax=Kryptolebias marmoratus TaxID=37003 RepID=UPI0007F87233|nr:A-agglutinin anchorage subunit-like [Kryptolebias marmoratus]
MSLCGHPTHLFLLVFLNTIHFSKEGLVDDIKNLTRAELSKNVTLVRLNNSQDTLNCSLCKLKTEYKNCTKDTFFWIVEDYLKDSESAMEKKCKDKPEGNESISVFHMLCLLAKEIKEIKESMPECHGYETAYRLYSILPSSSTSNEETPPRTCVSTTLSMTTTRTTAKSTTTTQPTTTTTQPTTTTTQPTTTTIRPTTTTLHPPPKTTKVTRLTRSVVDQTAKPPTTNGPNAFSLSTTVQPKTTSISNGADKQKAIQAESDKLFYLLVFSGSLNILLLVSFSLYILYSRRQKQRQLIVCASDNSERTSMEDLPNLLPQKSLLTHPGLEPAASGLQTLHPEYIFLNSSDTVIENHPEHNKTASNRTVL